MAFCDSRISKRRAASTLDGRYPLIAKLQTNCRNYIIDSSGDRTDLRFRAPLFLLLLQEIISDDSLDRRRNPGAKPVSYARYKREPRARTEETHALEYQPGAGYLVSDYRSPV